MDERARMALRIDEATDVAALRLIMDEAGEHADPRIQALRFKAAARLVKLRSGENLSASVVMPITGPSFASAYGIGVRSNLPLYRYRLTDKSYERLQNDLARSGGYSGLETGFRPALFVLWASEWFRRCYRGGGHRWIDVVGALGLHEDQSKLRSIAAKGLEQWGRPVLRAGHGREYLASLAREGGFPVAAVEQGGRGWARDVLAAVVAPLLAEPGSGQEQAESLARARRNRLPKTYQDDEFSLLCADLAMAVVTIRRETDALAQAAGLPLLVWLDQHRREWRGELPLTIGSAGAEALLGELLMVEAAAVDGKGVRVERWLVREGEGPWAEAVRVTLDGPIDGQVMRGIDPARGRLRLFAAGEFARSAPGELAMLEPPSEGETHWVARATRRTLVPLPVAFATSIECDLRAGEERITRIQLPQGKPRRGQLLICTIAQGDAEAPTALKVEGSGSGLFIAETLVLQVPGNWKVEGQGDEQVVPLGPGVGGAVLWRVVGGALVTDDEGDCYRIRAGQSRDRKDRIEIDDHPVRWAGTQGDVDLFAGPPAVRAGDRTRGALHVREIGARGGWRPAPSPLPLGHYEIGWREGPLLLDRRRIAIVPREAALACTGRGREARWMLSGWYGAALVPDAAAPIRVEGEVWRARPASQATYRFDARIEWPNAPPLDVTIPFPNEAAIARWDGSLLPPNSQVTLADLPDLLAVNPGRMMMFGELIERGGRGDPAVMQWDYHDELPMSSAAGDIASMLLPASNDAIVKLGMLDGIEDFWFVKPFPVRLERIGNALAASEGIVVPDAVIVGRAFVDPTEERSFGAYSLIASANHRPFGLPADCDGEWMIYLRDGKTVLSRPEILAGELPAPSQRSELARAMALPPWQGLTAALEEVLAQAAGNGPEAAHTVTKLVGLVASLNGLPPSSFEVLRLLPKHPDVLARMVLTARPEERDAVLALSDALPFAWCLVPKRCWDAAGHMQMDRLLADMGSIDGAAVFAMQAMAKAIARISEIQPLLGPVLKGARSGVGRVQIAQDFARRVIDGRATGHPPGSRYRTLGLKLPADHLNLPDAVLEWLDAPWAAALAVIGAWVPGADEVRHVKTVARTFPTFFADAFAASLQELI